MSNRGVSESAALEISPSGGYEEYYTTACNDLSCVDFTIGI